MRKSRVIDILSVVALYMSIDYYVKGVKYGPLWAILFLFVAHSYAAYVGVKETLGENKLAATIRALHEIGWVAKTVVPFSEYDRGYAHAKAESRAEAQEIIKELTK